MIQSIRFYLWTTGSTLSFGSCTHERLSKNPIYIQVRNLQRYPRSMIQGQGMWMHAHSQENQIWHKRISVTSGVGITWHKTQQYQWGLSLGSSWQRLDEGLCAGSLFGGQWPQRSGVRHGKGKIRKKKNKTNTDWLPLSSARPWRYQDFLRHLMKDGSKLCAQEREGWSICPLLALPNDEVLPRVALSPLQF